MKLLPLPPVLDLKGLQQNIGIGKTSAYALAVSGELVSLTVGAPGKRGSRRFLTESVLAYIERRRVESKPLRKKADEEAAAPANV